MLSHASITIGFVPMAETEPVMTRLGKENTATGPVGVCSSRALMVAPAGTADVGAVSVVVLNVPPAMT